MKNQNKISSILIVIFIALALMLIAIGSDWTVGSPEALVLWVYGDPNNPDTEQMYVKLNGAKVTYSADLTQEDWQQLTIDLTAFGIDLTNVTTLTIGFERTGTIGGSGMILLDDIQLYRPREQ